jgi:hypothetical protein
MKYTINELANSKGVSQPVREALLHMEAEIVKANAQAEHFEREWYLRGDELEATNRQVEILSDALAESRREIDALVALARADERERLAPVIKAAEGVMEWTELGYTQPVRDKLEVGRMVRVRLHALADLHEAIRARCNT